MRLSLFIFALSFGLMGNWELQASNRDCTDAVRSHVFQTLEAERARRTGPSDLLELRGVFSIGEVSAEESIARLSVLADAETAALLRKVRSREYSLFDIVVLDKADESEIFSIAFVNPISCVVNDEQIYFRGRP